MKTVEIQVPDEVMKCIEHLLATQGKNYVSVNTSEVAGREALLTDLLILGLEALEEADFPDDLED